jgi:hypothetical protein
MTRQTIFTALYTCLNASPPTYTYEGTTYTYTILSAFPEVAPVYPCIVINPAMRKTKSLGVAWINGKERYDTTVDIDFYAKSSHRKSAIDSARDTVQTLISALQSTSLLLNHNFPFEDSSVDEIDFNGEKLNTATISVIMVEK